MPVLACLAHTCLRVPALIANNQFVYHSTGQNYTSRMCQSKMGNLCKEVKESRGPSRKIIEKPF